MTNFLWSYDSFSGEQRLDIIYDSFFEEQRLNMTHFLKNKDLI